MSLQDDVDTINAYTQWKVTRGDTSPETFVKDRAKEVAFEHVERALRWIDDNWDSFDDGGALAGVVGTIQDILEGKTE